MAPETKREHAEPTGDARFVRGDGGSEGKVGPDDLMVRPQRRREGLRPQQGTTVTSTEVPLTTPSGAARPLLPPSLPAATHAVLRIGAGLLFMQHGAQKLFGLLGGMDGAGGTSPLMSQIGLAGVLEFFGGALLVLGLLTRPAAVVLAAEMLVAYFQAHAPQGGLPVQNGGELALLYVIVFLFFVGNGPGPWSLDRRLFPRLS